MYYWLHSSITHTQILLTLNDRSHTTITHDKFFLTVNNRTHSTIDHTQLLLTIRFCLHTLNYYSLRLNNDTHSNTTHTQYYVDVLVMSTYGWQCVWCLPFTWIQSHSCRSVFLPWVARSSSSHIVLITDTVTAFILASIFLVVNTTCFRCRVRTYRCTCF